MFTLRRTVFSEVKLVTNKFPAEILLNVELITVILLKMLSDAVRFVTLKVELMVPI